MKNKIAAAVLISALIFTGCQGKNAHDTNKSAVSPVSQEQTSGSISSNTAAGNKENSNVSEAGSNKTDSIQNNLKPGTVPQLNQSQKSQIDSKVKPVVNNIKDSLKSLEDVKDINLN